MMDRDMTIRVEKPTDLTIESTIEQKAYYEKQDKGNHLALMVMKRTIFKGLMWAIPSTNNAKMFFTFFGERYVVSRKTKASQLMEKFVNMRYDETGGIREFFLRWLLLLLDLVNFNALLLTLFLLTMP